LNGSNRSVEPKGNVSSEIERMGTNGFSNGFHQVRKGEIISNLCNQLQKTEAEEMLSNLFNEANIIAKALSRKTAINPIQRCNP
jgi:hypothetical protein